MIRISEERQIVLTVPWHQEWRLQKKKKKSGQQQKSSNKYAWVGENATRQKGPDQQEGSSHQNTYETIMHKTKCFVNFLGSQQHQSESLCSPTSQQKDFPPVYQPSDHQITLPGHPRPKLLTAQLGCSASQAHVVGLAPKFFPLAPFYPVLLNHI